MEAEIRVVSGGVEQLPQLASWLKAEDDLRGLVKLRELPPAAEELGVDAEFLSVVLGPGGVAVVVIGGVFTWLRSRTTRIKIRVQRADGAEIELETGVARRIAVSELSVVVDGLAEWMAGTNEIPPNVRKQLTADEARDVT